MNEPNKSFIEEFLNGGWVIPFLGAAAMVARILTVPDTSANTIGSQLRRVFVAAISSTVMWGLIRDVDLLDVHKAIIHGITGVISPEIINGLVVLGKKFSKNPQTIIKRD